METGNLKAERDCGDRGRAAPQEDISQRRKMFFLRVFSVCFPPCDGIRRTGPQRCATRATRPGEFHRRRAQPLRALGGRTTARRTTPARRTKPSFSGLPSPENCRDRWRWRRRARARATFRDARGRPGRDSPFPRRLVQVCPRGAVAQSLRCPPNSHLSPRTPPARAVCVARRGPSSIWIQEKETRQPRTKPRRGVPSEQSRFSWHAALGNRSISSART